MCTEHPAYIAQEFPPPRPLAALAQYPRDWPEVDHVTGTGMTATAVQPSSHQTRVVGPAFTRQWNVILGCRDTPTAPVINLDWLIDPASP